jgi:hypothetical protein
LLFNSLSFNLSSRTGDGFSAPYTVIEDLLMTLSKQLRIFLLYARSDEQAVRRLYQRLLKEGASVWLDHERLIPGQDWALEIHKAIHRSDIVIACLSRQFNKQGGFRHEELRIALEKANSLPAGQIFLIPARLEMCDLPEPLRRWQRVDLFESSGYQALLKACQEYIASTLD